MAISWPGMAGGPASKLADRFANKLAGQWTGRRPTTPRRSSRWQPSRLPQPRGRVAEALARGQRPSEIAAALGVSKSTVSFHLARFGATPGGEYQARRAACGTLARSGVRARELCHLRPGD